MLLALDHALDVYEYTVSSGGDPASTDDPFNPNDNWWTRRRALVPAYGEVVHGQLRDFLFGNRAGEFWAIYFERGLLAPLSRPDTDFLRRLLLREQLTGICWLIDFDPRVFDAPLPHIECYAQVLALAPVNRD